MALSKKDLMIHITLNELYNTHSLILQHVETLVCFFFDAIVLLLQTDNPDCSLQMTSNTYAF